MRVALYARVSISDCDPDTQFAALRDFCEAQGWQMVEEYVDKVSAIDLRRRVSWRNLLDDAARREGFTP